MQYFHKNEWQAIKCFITFLKVPSSSIKELDYSKRCTKLLFIEKQDCDYGQGAEVFKS